MTTNFQVSASKFLLRWDFFFVSMVMSCKKTLHFLFTPVIPLKSDLAVELQEKGRVRFWLQAAQMSSNGKVDYVFNDNVLSQGDVSEMFNSFFMKS